MKTLNIILWIILLLWIFHSTYADNEKEEQIRIYGHVYNEDKNNPLKNMNVYTIKNWDILSTWKTTKEGKFDQVLKNRSDYINLCVQSTSYSTIKSIDYCVTISAYQKMWIEVDGVIIREIEYNFYTNFKWENLNELYEEEITHEKTEEDFTEYEENILIRQEEAEKKEAERLKQELIEKNKAKYKMVSNTEMSWPLESMQIIGTVKSGSWANEELDYNRTYITVVDHKWNKIKEERLSKLYDYNITVKPKEIEVFLHPVNLRVENRQYNKIGDDFIQVYENEYRLVYNEKNIFNIVLEPKNITELDKTKEVRSNLPIIEIISIILVLIFWIIIIIKNKTNINTNDY